MIEINLRNRTVYMVETNQFVSMDHSKLCFDLLVYFSRNKNAVLDKDQILINVWGTNAKHIRAVDTYVYNLRKLVGDGIIQTVVGCGYRFVADIQVIDECIIESTLIQFETLLIKEPQSEINNKILEMIKIMKNGR